MVGWRAWYADGTIYDSEEHNWEDLPDDGVVTVVVFQQWIPSSNKTKRYRRINDGYDFYFHYKDTIICNNLSPEENKERFPEARDFKRGKWVSDAEFKEFSKLADKARWHDEQVELKEDCKDC